jgi:perosamine synthetase
MMTGEGGMLVTNDEKIAQIARMIRNHGEMIVSSQKKRTYKSDILGWGYRMTELEAALGIAQLKKLEEYNDTRRNLVKYLTKNLSHIKGIEHTVYDHVKHSYYDFAARYDEKETGIPRELFIKALQAEGIPFGAGYVRPLYLNPIYHEGKPYAYKHYQGDAKYEKGMCPVTESIHEKFLISTSVLRPPATEKDVDDIVFAINKIFENKDELLKFNS